eukprot:scaffold15368_cov60-Attheya_sp.AAC.1
MLVFDIGVTDTDSANDVTAAKCVAGYVHTTTVTDAKDAGAAGAAEAFTPVWVPSSAEDVTVTAAEGVAASVVESVVAEIAEGAGSSEDFARVLARVWRASSSCLDPSYLPSVTGIGQAVINSLF